MDARSVDSLARMSGFADGEEITGLKALKHKGFFINVSDDLISEILEMANEEYQTELAEIYA